MIDRLADKRKRSATSRGSETPEQTRDRLAEQRERSATSRTKTITRDLSGAAFNYNPNLNYHLHPDVVIGKMEVVCPHCSAYKWKDEAPGLCCLNGKVKLIALSPDFWGSSCKTW